MTILSEYQNKYAYIKLFRNDAGVLRMQLHCGGGKFIWGFRQHEEVTDCLLNISRDRENKVIILTGTGDVFLDEFEPMNPAEVFKPTFKDFTSHHGSVGYRLIQNHLDVEVPMIGVVNGPASIHAEIAVLCDIVLCADDAYFQDAPHFPNGIVPGDGVQIIWPELLGVNRGRYFILMGEKISAAEAKQLGIVGEVMPRDRLAARAEEIAAALARKDHIMLRHSRAVLVQKMRKQFAEMGMLGIYASYASALAESQVQLGDIGTAKG
jgi:enoyl-CoA hydratase/carnithine racemase